MMAGLIVAFLCRKKHGKQSGHVTKTNARELLRRLIRRARRQRRGWLKVTHEHYGKPTEVTLLMDEVGEMKGVRRLMQRGTHVYLDVG